MTLASQVSLAHRVRRVFAGVTLLAASLAACAMPISPSMRTPLASSTAEPATGSQQRTPTLELATVRPAPTARPAPSPTVSRSPLPTLHPLVITAAAPTPAPGAVANGGSMCPRVSADGRYVAVSSNASNLAPGDTNEVWDVFVHDRATGHTERVSVATGGVQANDGSHEPAISANGRWVAFSSQADNLVAGDTNEVVDVFLHDRETGRTELVSVGLGGAPADGHSDRPAISANGRYVTFASRASNLVPGDAPRDRLSYYVYDRESRSIQPAEAGPEPGSEVSANGRWEMYSVREPYPTATPGTPPKMAPGVPPIWTTLYLRERSTGEARTIARFLAPWRGFASCVTNGPRLSADGRWAAYLAPTDDTLRFYGLYLYDRESGQSQMVSAAEDGGTPDHDCSDPSISADGRIIAFTCLACNLVPGLVTNTTNTYVYDRDTGRIERVDVASR